MIKLEKDNRTNDLNNFTVEAHSITDMFILTTLKQQEEFNKEQVNCFKELKKELVDLKQDFVKHDTKDNNNAKWLVGMSSILATGAISLVVAILTGAI